MKKLLLTLAALAVAAGAQAQYFDTSFETSEGIVIGALDSQDGWFNDSDGGTQVVSGGLVYTDTASGLTIDGGNQAATMPGLGFGNNSIRRDFDLPDADIWLSYLLRLESGGDQAWVTLGLSPDWHYTGIELDGNGDDFVANAQGSSAGTGFGEASEGTVYHIVARMVYDSLNAEWVQTQAWVNPALNAPLGAPDMESTVGTGRNQTDNRIHLFAANSDGATFDAIGTGGSFQDAIQASGVIPEPSAIALVGMGALALFVLGRRR